MNVKWLFAIMNTKMNKDGVKISLSKTKPEEKLGGCIAPFLLLERAGLEAPELKLHPETDDRDRVLVEKGASHSKLKTSHFSDSILIFFHFWTFAFQSGFQLVNFITFENVVF